MLDSWPLILSEQLRELESKGVQKSRETIGGGYWRTAPLAHCRACGTHRVWIMVPDYSYHEASKCICTHCLFEDVAYPIEEMEREYELLMRGILLEELKEEE